MIGIFDSGVGGLSVFREIRKVLPEEKYIYFSDSAHCPYGEKTREYVTERSREITRALLDAGADIIVVACNTATAAAIAAMREEFPVSFIGMEPAVKPAALSTRTGVVGVLATAGTLKADKYLNTRGRFSDGIKIVEHVGQGFVETVEKGITTGPETEKMVKESLAPLLNEGADRIVLGCTHYPFLMETIKKVSDEMFPERGVEIIDPAPAVARHLLDVMEEKGLIRQDGYSITLKSSGDMEQLQGMYKKLIKE